MIEEQQNDVNENQTLMTELCAQIVCAYVSNNTLPSGDVPEFIESVRTTLVKAGTVHSSASNLGRPEKPAVSIKKSLNDEYLICLEDGLKFKSLKRHLNSKYGLSPDQYRARWGLPSDYPMVAPAYARKRSELAKKVGLGRARKK